MAECLSLLSKIWCLLCVPWITRWKSWWWSYSLSSVHCYSAKPSAPARTHRLTVICICFYQIKCFRASQWSPQVWNSLVSLPLGSVTNASQFPLQGSFQFRARGSTMLMSRPNLPCPFPPLCINVEVSPTSWMPSCLRDQLSPLSIYLLTQGPIIAMSFTNLA